MYNGAMHLSDYMVARGLSDDEVADAIKRTRPTVSRIRRRLVRPDWETITALREWSQGEITANDFEAAAEAAE